MTETPLEEKVYVEDGVDLPGGPRGRRAISLDALADVSSNCCALVASKFLFYFIFYVYFLFVYLFILLSLLLVFGVDTPQPTRKGDRTCEPPARGSSPAAGVNVPF